MDTLDDDEAINSGKEFIEELRGGIFAPNVRKQLVAQGVVALIELIPVTFDHRRAFLRVLCRFLLLQPAFDRRTKTVNGFFLGRVDCGEGILRRPCTTMEPDKVENQLVEDKRVLVDRSWRYFYQAVPLFVSFSVTINLFSTVRQQQTNHLRKRQHRTQRAHKAKTGMNLDILLRVLQVTIRQISQNVSSGIFRGRGTIGFTEVDRSVASQML